MNMNAFRTIVVSAAIAPLIALGSGPATAAPVPGVLGEPCSTNLVGVDTNTGRSLTCVDDGKGGSIWTDPGPIVGVHNMGDPCNAGVDFHSQTTEGRPISCNGGQWVHWP